MFLSKLAPSKLTLTFGLHRDRAGVTDLNAYGRQPAERALNEVPFAIWVARAPDGEVIYTNQALRAMVGVALDEAAEAKDEVAEAPTIELLARSGEPYPRERLPQLRAIAGGAPVVTDDLVLRREDGRLIYVRASANPVLDATGAVSHVVVALTDITADVRTQAERAERERRLEAAVHDAPVLLFMLDREGTLTAADGALRTVLEGAREGESLVGVSLLDVYMEHPKAGDSIRRALAGETVSFTVETHGLTLDVWLGPLPDGAGGRAGAIGACVDVTEARRQQGSAIQNDRIRAIGTVASSIAHEINNPLTYVLAGLEESSGQLDGLVSQVGALGRTSGNGALATMVLEGLGRLQEHLVPVLAGTKRIREVARGLRAFARPDGDKLTRVDVAEVTRVVLKLVNKEIEVRARLVDEIDACPPVLANEPRLVQVLTSLLVNAWQALPEPDPARHVIGVRTGHEGAWALIEVWDSGPGVPAHLREQIFEPFVTTKEPGAGSGLGLFVCRNIVASLSGQISVEDAPGGGALFRVLLPPAAPTIETLPPAPAEPRPVVSDRRRVLIIDDDPLVAEALESSLVSEGFEVRTVLDGLQGLEILLKSDDVDLAYCDVMMKGFSGVDLHEALRRDAPARLAKVVFMSGGASTDEARAFLEERAADFVQKPFDILADANARLGGQGKIKDSSAHP
jgi:PAS domain S-box-containing protein